MNEASVEKANSKRVSLAKMKNELVYVNGQYLPDKLVPLSADEIATDRFIGRAHLVLGFVFLIGVNGLWDFLISPGKPFAISPILSVPLMVSSAFGIYGLVRLQDVVARVQHLLDRYRAKFGSEMD